MLKVVLLMMLVHPDGLRVAVKWEETNPAWKTVQDCEDAYKTKVSQSIKDTGVTDQGYIVAHSCRLEVL